MSVETWDPAGGASWTIEEVVAHVSAIEGRIDGVTISGGEPFEQAPALRELLLALDRWRSTRAEDVDFLSYSGVSWRRLDQEHADVLELLDALVPEPFLLLQPRRSPWTGSSNQPIVALSELGERRYGSTVDLPVDRSLQVRVANGSLSIVGIPERGDLERLAQDAARAGVRLEVAG